MVSLTHLTKLPQWAVVRHRYGAHSLRIIRYSCEYTFHTSLATRSHGPPHKTHLVARHAPFVWVLSILWLIFAATTLNTHISFPPRTRIDTASLPIICIHSSSRFKTRLFGSFGVRGIYLRTDRARSAPDRHCAIPTRKIAVNIYIYYIYRYSYYISDGNKVGRMHCA